MISAQFSEHYFVSPPQFITEHTNMGAGCVGHGGHVSPRFCEANLKSLILTIGAPPPRFILCSPSFINVPSQFS